MSEKLYKLFIGLNDKITKKQEFTIEGYTIIEGNGFYTHSNGCQVTEQTLIVELLFIDYETVVKLCNALKASLNQESIALQQIELTKCELV